MINVRWGSYGAYEGPWYPGTQSFSLPANPTFADEVLAVITATEGGHWDAINRYDSCIDTQGLIQWCNRAPQCSVDGMYAALQAHDPALLTPVLGFFEARGYGFADGHWKGQEGPVDTPAEQLLLYFLGASGRKGTWDTASKTYAQRAVAAAVEVWQDPRARVVQAAWTVKRLDWFLLTDAKKLFAAAPDTAVARAFKAMYWSFAANSPKKAAEALAIFLVDTGGSDLWTEQWLVGVAKYLTFTPGISIYPHRYDKIRPVLEKLYGVNLPDFAAELQAWQAKNQFRLFFQPVELQRALQALGYDIGPQGADGSIDAKTTAALKDFEADLGVAVPDGLVDPKTAELLEAALERRGIQSLA